MENLALLGQLSPEVQETSKEIINDPAFANYKTVDELFKAHIDLTKKSQASPDWVSSLPEEQRPVIAVKGWKTPSDMIKSYSELEKLVGHEKIAMPRKDKDGNYEAGELERVMTQLGLPKDAKEYKESANFKLPEGIALNGKTLEEFKSEARKVGLLPNQYAFVMDKLAGILNQGTEAQKAANEKAFNEATLNLRSKWGSAYDDKAKLANSILKNFSDQNKAADIIKKYGNDPMLIELLANVGDNLSEEALSKTNMSGMLLTPEAAQLEINKIKADGKHPYMDAQHPDHNFWVKRMSELYQMLG